MFCALAEVGKSCSRKPFVSKKIFKNPHFNAPQKLGAIIRKKESKDYAKWKESTGN